MVGRLGIGPYISQPRRRVSVGRAALLVMLAAGVARPAAATNARALHLLAEGTTHAQRREYTMAERRLRAALPYWHRDAAT